MPKKTSEVEEFVELLATALARALAQKSESPQEKQLRREAARKAVFPQPEVLTPSVWTNYGGAPVGVLATPNVRPDGVVPDDSGSNELATPLGGQPGFQPRQVIPGERPGGERDQRGGPMTKEQVKRANRDYEKTEKVRLEAEEQARKDDLIQKARAQRLLSSRI